MSQRLEAKPLDRRRCWRARSSSSIRSTFEYRKRALEKIFQTE
jgi:hypothetical protein